MNSPPLLGFGLQAHVRPVFDLNPSPGCTPEFHVAYL